ncbi:ABC transporter permease [Herbivorax sp. ANBcel31]|uniref:ABC transporter permease n=1 Tax=Herbivorax sp. ANBcel31 TaxID=3069754 RepID=UPI0027B64A8A|nr:ABC transporter permease [Herbivorax sp. ANBcel31]MDQ2087780.1 ABC transporter permease [Herbivorax sp. ANBcel31]
MPVFKLSTKIIRKNLAGMMIYLVIFIGMTLLFANLTQQEAPDDFTQSKVNLAFIAEEESILIEGFKENLSQYANFVDIQDNREALQDALFFREVSYILRIPEGFTQSFMNGESIEIEKTIVPASTSGAYVDTTVNQFFDLASVYINTFGEIGQKELVERVNDNMDKEVAVSFIDETNNQINVFQYNYFNFLAYSMFAILVLGISSIIMVLNKRDIKMRNICSPVSQFKMKLQLFFGVAFFAILVWAVMMIFYMIFDGENVLDAKTIYYMLNAFIFAIAASSVSFLIGNIVTSKDSLSAVTNVVTLGPCFISGIFVPQEILSDTVLRIASFTPTYWFAKSNIIIANATDFSFNSLKPLFKPMMIELGFAILFLSIALVLIKKRIVSDS